MTHKLEYVYVNTGKYYFYLFANKEDCQQGSQGVGFLVFVECRLDYPIWGFQNKIYNIKKNLVH